MGLLCSKNFVYDTQRICGVEIGNHNNRGFFTISAVYGVDQEYGTGRETLFIGPESQCREILKEITTNWYKDKMVHIPHKARLHSFEERKEHFMLIWHSKDKLVQFFWNPQYSDLIIYYTNLNNEEELIRAEVYGKEGFERDAIPNIRQIMEDRSKLNDVYPLGIVHEDITKFCWFIFEFIFEKVNNRDSDDDIPM